MTQTAALSRPATAAPARAPANAPSGTADRPRAETDHPVTRTSVAPTAAPLAEPTRNGSASGLRKRPWYAAPAAARPAPASPANNDRGSRVSNTIARSTGSESGEKTERRTRSGGTQTGP